MTRQDIIDLGYQLSCEELAADSLWESLPSAAAAQKHYGDYWLEHRPSLHAIIQEATHVLLAAEFGKTGEELVEWFYCDTSDLNVPPPPYSAKLHFICTWLWERTRSFAAN